MAKHILNGVEGFDKRGGEFFMVDPTVIKVVDGWNHRKDFTGEEDLITSIIENGVKVPLLVRKTEYGTLELVDGERRLRATLEAIRQGNSIKSVPVQVAKRGTNDIDLYIDSLVRNDSKPPTPTEEAEAYTRLVKWGLSVKEIAVKVGRSETLVRNRLKLNNAAPAVKKALDKKEISTKAATEIAGNESIEKQTQALKSKKPKPVVFSFVDGKPSHKGAYFENYDFLYDLMTRPLYKKLIDNGFDPDTFKITVKPIEIIN